jgi:hypothetical protein
MSKTLDMVIEPHAVIDAVKFANLIAAYQADADVPAVTLLDAPGGLFAICGSHRIAAAREVYESDADVETDLGWTVLDANEAYEAADADVRAMLDDLFAGRGVDFELLEESL